jgi:hypothetical protein
MNAEIEEEAGYSPTVCIVMTARKIPLVVDAHVLVAALHLRGDSISCHWTKPQYNLISSTQNIF